MAVKIKLTIGEEEGIAIMRNSPGEVAWSGNNDLIEDIEFRLSMGYGAAGHVFTPGGTTTALDLATVLVHQFGQEGVDVLEGVEILEAEEAEIAKIEEKGKS
jgi:hypothetical protein